MDILGIFQLAIQYGPLVKQVIDEATSNDDIVTKIKSIAAPLVPLLEQIGSALFPKAAPAIHIVGGVVAAFDPNVTKWLQSGLNTYLTPSPNLVVDGMYGPLTRAAVETLQKQLGLTVDGLAGQITRSALDAVLAALSKGQQAVPPPAPAV